MQYTSFGFIGGGRITRIILSAFKRTGNLPGKVVVSDTNAHALADLKKYFPSIEVAVDDNRKLSVCDMVFVSLHPPVLMGALGQVKSLIKPDSVVVSLAPKINLTRLSATLDRHARIVRMIPNAPSIVNRGYNPLAFSRGIPADEKAAIIKLFEILGECPEVPEKDLEAYAIIAAMGPTYFWFQWQTLVELGKSFGLTEASLRVGIAKMASGAIDTLFGSSLSPEEVMDLVPVRPLADDEEAIRNMYRTRLSALFERLKG
jgi:pyrroline-5-carboxylate reductase